MDKLLPFDRQTDIHTERDVQTETETTDTEVTEETEVNTGTDTEADRERGKSYRCWHCIRQPLEKKE